MYEVGKVYDFAGESRRVTGFDGADNVITEPAPGVAAGQSGGGLDARGLVAILPMEKCNVAELQGIAAFLGVELVPAAVGKEMTKAEIIAQIGA